MKKKIAGRPTKYQKSYVGLAEKLAEKGLTDEQIAYSLGACTKTLYTWKEVHPEFADAIKRGKVIADQKVVEALFKLATGYSHPDTHISVINGEVVKTEITKHYAPDYRAASLWLRNRLPEEWRDKVEVKQTVVDAFPPKEELDAIYEKAMQEAAVRQEKMRAERKNLNIDIDSLFKGDEQE